MDDQLILACNGAGVFSGKYIPKKVGHTGKGRRHLAIAVLLYNYKGQVLLQKRKHQVFDNIWDVTGATHPLHRGNNTDETLEEATQRCLKVEYDIDNITLKNLGAFNYFAKYDGLCENEHCYLLIGEYNGQFKLNLAVGYGYKWVDMQEFLKDIEAHPKNYSPWAIKSVELLKKERFFKA
ncbi:NUDIX domain-containing protein [Candidatus Daviesbacteria bacterium]|nr:NUDIX domain-containing protein [Candidatus Daviesbacteria bacterium]